MEKSSADAGRAAEARPRGGDRLRSARPTAAVARARVASVLVAAGAVLAAAAASAQAPIACFTGGELAPGTREAVAELRAATAGALQPAFAQTRWLATATDPDTGVAGDPVVVTWGIALDGTTGIGAPFSSIGEVAGPSNLVSTLDGWLGRATWMALFEESFQAWTDVTGVVFVYEPEDDGTGIPQTVPPNPGQLGVRADIRIGGHPIDGAGGVVAYARPPEDGDIVIDTTDQLFYTASANGYRRLRNTLMHEIGHAMGLEHVCPENASKLMEPIIVTSFDGVQHDDVIAMQSFYGDRRENDDDDTEAFDLGIGIGETDDSLDFSIDDELDEDWIAIPNLPGLSVDVRMLPYGEVYSIADSNFSGTCDGVSSTGVNTLVNRDLAVEVRDGSGAVLAAADVNGPGGVEQLTGVEVSGGGFVRVFGDAGSALQVYDLRVTYVPEPSASSLAAAAIATLAVVGHARRRRPGRPTARR